ARYWMIGKACRQKGIGSSDAAKVSMMFMRGDRWLPRGRLSWPVSRQRRTTRGHAQVRHS
ncbi:MAG: hypothetical protein ACK56I_21240, partial [bacterium]